MISKIKNSLLLTLVILFCSVSVVSANRCCPDGMTRCDGIGNDMAACVRDGHRNLVGQGSDQWCGRLKYCDQNWYDAFNPVPCERFTRPSFECSAEGDPITEELSCEWAPLNNVESEYHGRPAYCVGGFASVQELQASEVTFSCVDNCGGALEQLANRIGSGGVQQAPLGNAVYATGNDGTYYTCLTGDFDESIKSTIKSCLQDKGIAAVAGGGTGFILGALVPGPNIITIPVFAIGGAKLAESVMGDCEPKIRATTRGYDNTCRSDLVIELNLDTKAGNLESVNNDYVICETNLGKDETPGSPYSSCKTCFDGGGMWTAAGCIRRSPQSLVGKIVSIMVGIMGGIVLLRVLAASFILVTSQGDIKKTTDAKQMLSEAIVGAIFILFSVTILQFIGDGVLKIPGFGG